jgi:hypothetical protein
MRVFRYLPPRGVDCLESEELCFTPSQRFNDPFEQRPVLSLTINRTSLKFFADRVQWVPDLNLLDLLPAERIRRQTDLQESFVEHYLIHPDQLTEKLQADMLQVLNDRYGLLCFSATKDSLLMWAHYAASHRGFVLEFDSEDRDFEQLGELREITYGRTRPILNPTKDPTIAPFLRKSQEWSYEREFRIMRPLRTCKERPIDGVACFFVRMPRSCIRGVYLGCRMDQGVASKISGLMASTPAQLHQAELHSREFRLVFKPLK